MNWKSVLENYVQILAGFRRSSDSSFVRFSRCLSFFQNQLDVIPAGRPLDELRELYFGEWGWENLAITATLDNHLMSQEKFTRRLSPWLNTSLFMHFLESAGYSCAPIAGCHRFIKVQLDDTNQILDMDFNAAIANKEEFHSFLQAIQLGSRRDPLDHQKVDEYLAHCLRELAQVVEKFGNNALKIDFYTAVLRYFPTDVGSLAARALCYQKDGELQKAFSDLKRFFQLTMVNQCPPHLLRAYQLICLELGRTEEYFTVSRAWNLSARVEGKESGLLEI